MWQPIETAPKLGPIVSNEPLPVPDTKDCPFCGGEGLLRYHTAYWVECEDCEATGSVDDDDRAAVIKWNMRLASGADCD